MVITINIEVLGINLSYIEEGNINKQTLVFLHGWGANKNTFLNIINKLKDDYHILALDLPGFGDSVIYKELYLDDVTEIIYNFLIKKNVKEPIIIAHSYGGRVAILYASKYYVKSLVLIASAGIKKKKNFKNIISVKIYKLLKSLKFNVNMGSKDYKDASIVLRKMLVNAVNRDLRKEMNQITTPTLLIYGKNDNVTDKYVSELIHKNIKNSHLIYLDDCGHFLYLEEPSIFLLILNSFLSSGNND